MVLQTGLAVELSQADMRKQARTEKTLKFGTKRLVSLQPTDAVTLPEKHPLLTEMSGTRISLAQVGPS